MDRSNDGGLVDGGGADGSAEGVPDELTHLVRLELAPDFASLAGKGGEVKYLGRVADGRVGAPFDASCVFQNTRRFPYHVQFLRTFPAYDSLDLEAYVALVLRRSTRLFWGGGLKSWPGITHPETGRVGIISFGIYQADEESENLGVAEIAAVDRRIKGCAPYARDLLVFVPEGLAQIAFVRANAASLRDAGVAILDPTALRPGVHAEIYSAGEGYGYLRIVPRGEPVRDGRPDEVIIAEAAPNDIGPVAGLITVLPQSLHSHVNLRLEEKGIPNASVPAIYDSAFAAGLAGQIVRIIAAEEKIDLLPARREDAVAFWRARTQAARVPRADLGRKSFTRFERLAHSHADAFGVKAANLGELHRVLPPDSRVEGFAIPFANYRDFMTTSGLEKEVESLLGDPNLELDAARRRERLALLRKAIRRAPLPPDFLPLFERKANEVYGALAATVFLRLRSSTNAEDLEGISGAGLYSSRTGCLADDRDGDSTGPSRCLSERQRVYLEQELGRRTAELSAHPERSWLEQHVAELREDLTQEKPIADAVRKVWASLWEDRAFADRAYYGIDHRLVYMGIAVHPALQREQLEAVVVTNLPSPSAGGPPLYRVVSQAGELGVVRPANPGAVPETLTFRRGVAGEPEDVRLLTASSEGAPLASLWPPERLRRLALLTFRVQDEFARAVYPCAGASLSLDIEVDVTEDGRVLIKQVRPKVGR
jgi:hypothetical protein